MARISNRAVNINNLKKHKEVFNDLEKIPGISDLFSKAEKEATQVGVSPTKGKSTKFIQGLCTVNFTLGLAGLNLLSRHLCNPFFEIRSAIKGRRVEQIVKYNPNIESAILEHRWKPVTQVDGKRYSMSNGFSCVSDVQPYTRGSVPKYFVDYNLGPEGLNAGRFWHVDKSKVEEFAKLCRQYNKNAERARF